MTGNVEAPLFRHAELSRDIVGFNLQNSSQVSAPATYITFGQEFAAGALPAGSGLVATINGTKEAVQVDPKTFYADGSVQMAVLTLQQPTIPAETTFQGMLSVSTASTSVQSSVNLLGTLLDHSLVCNLSFLGESSHQQIDLIAALKAAIVSGTASSWLSGPQATQVSVSIPVSGSMRLLGTFTAYADGTFSTKVGFNNDIALSATGGAVTYSASIVQDGRTVFSQPTLTQYQYQNWNTTVLGGGGIASSVNLQHDVQYLEQIGAVPNYDLSSGVSPGVLQSETQAVTSPGWDSPLSNNTVGMYMPTTGGRGDIGPTTQGNATWLITQDPNAAAYALGQADASSAIPWNMWVPSTNTFLNTSHAADIWTDGRGGPGSYTTGLTQQVDSAGSGWTTDPAHQPDLSYYAYLLTGNKTYLDSLNAQASFSITDTWPAYRGAGQIVVNGQQIRAAAWSLREIDEASYANPTSSAEGQYFTQIANVNWQWLVDQIPAWTMLQGEAYGRVEGYYGEGNAIKIAPWQQDYFASTAIQAAEHGNANAIKFLNWESNFLVGRFLQQDNGFSPRDGIVYNLSVGIDGKQYSTWSQMEAATIAASQSNGDGWSQSAGDYGELALQTLAGIITVTGSADAIKAYNWLITSGAPYVNKQSLASDVQFDIIPKLPANLTFAADGTIVSANGSVITTTPPATPAATTATQTSTATPVNNGHTSTSSDSLVLNISEDAWQGDAQFTITIDGQQVGGTYTATAAHGAGQTQALSLPTSLSPGPHSIGVSFLNDAYGGSPSTDRNLFVDGATYNGTPIAGSKLTLGTTGTQNFSVSVADTPSPTPTPTPTPTQAASPANNGSSSSSSPLVLNISEDAWQGDAQFTITIDGQQVGGTYTATAAHGAGQTQALSLPTSLSPGPHSIGVSFLNDAYGGSPSTDRNLFVDGATYNGTPIAGSKLTLGTTGTQNFSVSVADTPSPTPTPTPTPTQAASPANNGSSSSSSPLVLNISEDAWQGDAQFTITIDGQQVGGTYTATAAHGAGQTQALSLPTSLSPGPHSIGVSFLNDAYGGSPSTDRNLFVDGATYNGTPIAGSKLTLGTTGTQNFSVSVADTPSPTPTPTPTPTQAASPANNGSSSSSSPLVLNISEDAWQGDAQFTIKFDGQQVGGIYTSTALHRTGEVQTFNFPTNFSPGEHSIGITFLNDSYGGTPSADRNLFVDGATYNGSQIAGSTLSLFTNETQNFTMIAGPTHST